MGKRKSSKPPPKKKIPKLDVTFKCPFCSHDGSVSCKLNFDEKAGELECNICKEKFTTKITSLSKPVDVYYAWVDACQQENE